MRTLIAAFLTVLPFAALAQDHRAKVEVIVSTQIQPGFAVLAAATKALKREAQNNCAATSAPLREAYHTAFDAWMAVSHLRFGPAETDNRAFAIAFWPDTRGATPQSLSELIQSQDPIVEEPDKFANVSIAARGLYAQEFLLFDPDFVTDDSTGYACALVRAVSADLVATTTAIANDWKNGDILAALLHTPNETYRSDTEAVQELFKALTAGLQFTSETRLGRPLGTFERPRPNRAEAHRSRRSLRNTLLSLESLRALALQLAKGDQSLTLFLEVAFDRAIKTGTELDDPIFAGVADPQGRLCVEIYQQQINQIRDIVALNLGPKLGVAAGFNALDGD